jgi:hypothetical protein
LRQFAFFTTMTTAAVLVQPVVDPADTATKAALASTFHKPVSNPKEPEMTSTCLAAIAAAALLIAVPAVAQEKTSVTFAKGASSATLKGSIKGDRDHGYIVNARAGQTLTVDFKPTNASAYFNILAPGSSNEAMFVGSASGNRFSGPLTVTGPHTVQVYLMRNAARRNETASYTLTIAVKGGAAAPRPSRDALVAGTKYNATAAVPCVTSASGKTGSCQAGVIRRRGGDATVELKNPDGGQRRIFFTGGRATGSDAQTSFSTARQGDVQIVRIGSIEVYRIPDALVVGG